MGRMQREEEADTFASFLLMPLDDYRAQVDGEEITGNLFRHITERYGASLIALAESGSTLRTSGQL